MKNIQLDITKSNSVPSEADAIAAYEPSESRTGSVGKRHLSG